MAATVIVDTRAQIERSYTAIARVLLSSVDAELQSELRTLQGLASSSTLLAGDFPVFHDEARRFAAAHGDWLAITLSDIEGHGQLLNTAVDYTGVVRPLLETASVVEAARTGKPVVGPILPRGIVWQKPFIVLRVPVVRAGEVVFILSAAVSPNSIATLMNRLEVSTETLISVFDRQLSVVARSDGDRSIGLPASESIREQAASGRSGLFLNVALDGREYRRVLVTSPLTGWSVAVGSSRVAFDAVLMVRALGLAGVGTLAMLIAGAGVMVLQRRFGRRMATAERLAADELRAVNRDLAFARGQAEARAQRAEQLQADLEAVMNAVPVVVGIARDADCRTIVGNRFADNFFGVSRHANVSLSAPHSERAVRYRVVQDGVEIAPGDLPVQRAARGCEVRDWECDVVFDDGTVKSLIGNASPLRSPDGRVYGAVSAAIDVTVRKRLEADLRAQQEMLRLFVDGVPAGIAMFDTEMRYLAVSRRFAEDYGQETADLIGRSHYDVFPEIPEHWRAIHRCCLAGETRRCAEDPFPRADGRMGWVRWEIRPWFSASGQIGGIILFSEDITDRKAAEEKLHSAKAVAEEANAAKSRFLASVSHDLRQPLMAQRLLLHVAVSHAETLEQANVLARIGETLDSAETMLSRLMDLAALELGKVPVRREVFALDGHLSAILAESFGMAEAKGLLLRLWVASCWTESDPVLLGRILRNLVVNAIRYTDSGSVLVAVRRRGGHYRIEVRDSGKGIPANQQQVIFEKFHQLENPERNRTKGQGLGLAIVARTADLLGHRLFLRSAVDRGTVFAIEVPVVAGPDLTDAEDDSPIAPSQASRPARILLIEDDPVQSAALASILTNCGHRVTVAHEVAAALGVIPRGLGLIISDYRLPGGVTGLDGIASIRRACGRPVPALLLTGDTQTAIVTAAAAAGCAILHKPCTPVAVLNAIAAVCGVSPRKT
ncbi:MAG: ATP-binding protein [Rhodospirillaceae bacterium]